jgi:1-acyl-sn-glycerol-3-phosphate acyltransferase
MRRRSSPRLDHARLRWFRDETTTYHLIARYVVPAALWLPARVTVEGLEHVPLTGPVILAANHPDNWDGYLLLHLVPRTVHVAARQDAFGTGALCAFWRRLGVFPADSWGLRYALTLLEAGGAVALFPQGNITQAFERARGAAGVLALRSGAPVIPVAIRGTEAVHPAKLFGTRARVSVRFGPPLTFAPGHPGASHSLEVAEEILGHIAALLEDERPAARAGGH